jgi:WD40 repeat protein
VTAVRHLAGTIDGPRIAAAAFEHHVSVWDVRTRRHVSTFRTILDFGGSRLAMHPSGEWVVAAAYYVDGLAAYDAETGEPAWTRCDLKKLQIIDFSPDGAGLFAGSDNKPCLVLDARTGETVDSLRGVRAVYASPFEPLRLLDGPRPEVRTAENERRFRIARESFGTAAVAFSPAAVCISEAAGPVRCLDLASGGEVWRYVPPAGRHVLALAYLADGCFAAFEWAYSGGSGAGLMVLDGKDGSEISRHAAGSSHDATFALAGEILVTADGKLIRTRDGGVEDTLPLGRDFPPREPVS